MTTIELPAPVVPPLTSAQADQIGRDIMFTVQRSKALPTVVWTEAQTEEGFTQITTDYWRAGRRDRIRLIVTLTHYGDVFFSLWSVPDVATKGDFLADWFVDLMNGSPQVTTAVISQDPEGLHPVILRVDHELAKGQPAYDDSLPPLTAAIIAEVKRQLEASDLLDD